MIVILQIYFLSINCKYLYIYTYFSRSVINFYVKLYDILYDINNKEIKYDQFIFVCFSFAIIDVFLMRINSYNNKIKNSICYLFV